MLPFLIPISNFERVNREIKIERIQSGDLMAMGNGDELTSVLWTSQQRGERGVIAP